MHGQQNIKKKDYHYIIMRGQQNIKKKVSLFVLFVCLFLSYTFSFCSFFPC